MTIANRTETFWTRERNAFHVVYVPFALVVDLRKSFLSNYYTMHTYY
jgi:hypothetical protein